METYSGNPLQALEASLAYDLSLINYPPNPWIQSIPGVLDVAIIGAGMAGIAAAFALLRQGIVNIKLFDQNQEGQEGPWITYARMKMLRSTKELTGPAEDFPLLTFHAWHAARYGDRQWEAFRKVPNEMWMEYLLWFTHALKLNVQNHAKLLSISPEEGQLKLLMRIGNIDSAVLARKVILATGRGGFGGAAIPTFAEGLPKSYYAHTNESFDVAALKGKRVVIAGAGTSAFDAAAAALENGAFSVDMLMRRQQLININKQAHLVYPGYFHGYYFLSDEQRLRLLNEAQKKGAPPPIEALERVKPYPQFHLHPDTVVQHVEVENDVLKVVTNRKEMTFDFLILGTGFAIDGSKQPELSSFYTDILLWRDRLFRNPMILGKYGPYPYLGPHFEFFGRTEESSHYLKHIYCFNYGAFASHGTITGDIPGIGIGAQRLGKGIAIDFFKEDYDKHMENLKNYQTPEFLNPFF